MNTTLNLAETSVTEQHWSVRKQKAAVQSKAEPAMLPSPCSRGWDVHSPGPAHSPLQPWGEVGNVGFLCNRLIDLKIIKGAIFCTPKQGCAIPQKVWLFG